VGIRGKAFIGEDRLAYFAGDGAIARSVRLVFRRHCVVFVLSSVVGLRLRKTRNREQPSDSECCEYGAWNVHYDCLLRPNYSAYAGGLPRAVELHSEMDQLGSELFSARYSSEV
jgi:hypothetical protein